MSNKKNSKKKKFSKKWFDLECKTLRALLKQLSYKKHRNPLDTELRMQYHAQIKTRPLKNYLNTKKRLFLDSKIDDLVNNENQYNFWDTLKSMSDNNFSNNNDKTPTKKLYDHFKGLHSAPEPSTITAFQLKIKKKGV